MKRKLALPAAVADPSFVVLRSMRRVRGTPLDVFGYSDVRRTERRLRDDYESDIRALFSRLSHVDLKAAASYASLPLAIRGYEHIKLAAVDRYEQERAAAHAELGPR